MRSCALWVIALAAACGGQRAAGPTGSVKLSAKASPRLATSADGLAPLVCASFTLQPYSLDANGTPTLAGPPMHLTSVAASQTDTIAGCIAGPTDAAGDNWGYLVTATGFVDCGTGLAIPGLSPNTVTGNHPFDCKAGVDIPLSIDISVSIAAANSGGYVDISAGVNGTTVEVGCKTPDFNSGALHFGEANTAHGNSATPLGLVGYTADGQGADAALAQFGGQVFATNPDPAAIEYDTYYTGQFTAPAAGALPSTILQTFLSDPARQHPFDPATCTTEWADTQHPLCLTDTAALTAGAQLADAFLFLPGKGYAAVSVSSDQSALDLAAQMVGNSAGDYTSGFPAVESASSGFSSGASAPSPRAGFNDGLQVAQLLAAGATPPMTAFTGVFIDPVHLGGFLVAATDGHVGYQATLQWSGGAWTLGTFAALSAAPLPAGYGVSTSGCVVDAVACPCWSAAAAAEAQLIEGEQGSTTNATSTSADLYDADGSHEVYLFIRRGYCSSGNELTDNPRVGPLSAEQTAACLAVIADLAQNPCATNNGGCSGATPNCVYVGPGVSSCVVCTDDSQCAGNSTGALCDAQPTFFGDYIQPIANPNAYSCVQCDGPNWSCGPGQWCQPLTDTCVSASSVTFSDQGLVDSGANAVCPPGSRQPTVEELESAMVAQFTQGVTFGGFTFGSDYYTSDDTDGTDVIVAQWQGAGAALYNDYWGNGTRLTCISP